jgi:hypothetical protein
MDLMIDIETLATGPNATIMTIAAQVFDPLSTGWPDRHFYARVTPESQPTRDIDDVTVEWWAHQVPEAQREVFEEIGRRDLNECLEELGKLIWQSDKIWANGICFDMNILEHAFKECGMALPWKFWNVRDARTVYALWPDMPEVKSASHHALDDCKRQITMLQSCIKHLGVQRLK